MNSEEDFNKLLLRPREVAEILGLSKSYIYKLLVTGVIPSVLIGKCRRVRRDDIEKIIENGTRSFNK